jgi:probable HAF family extracellular repeat protein
MRKFGVLSTVLILLSVVPNHAAGSVKYNVTDLGNLGYSSYPAAINSAGQIVGTSYADSAQSEASAFLYDASSTGLKTMVALFGAGNYGNTANGINDSGQVVGSVLNDYAGEYQQDAYTGNINTLAFTSLSFNSTGVINFHGGYTGSRTAANAVNNNGDVAGTVVLPGDSANTTYGFTCSPSSNSGSIFPRPDLAFGSGIVASNNGINDSGIYVGSIATSSTGVPLAYYYNPAANFGSGSIFQINTPLDTSSTSYYATANAINDNGQVVGGGLMSTTGNYSLNAYRYDIFGAGTMIDLGALGTGNYSEAQGINSTGEIVGYSYLSATNLLSGGPTGPYHAFVYNSGGSMTDLNSLIPSNSGWDLEEATAVNASGWIVGYGINSAGATDGFLLTPVSEPATIALLLAGAACLLASAGWHRRTRAAGRASGTPSPLRARVNARNV